MIALAQLFLPLAFLGAPESLTTFAAASPRPALCRPAPGANGGELWSRVRRERAERFCVTLSRGYARLDRTPKDALGFARQAKAILPNEIEARVLEGRALLRLGELEAAREALATSVRAPGRPLGDVAALRELGVVLVSTGHVAEAASVYRLLVPRVDFVEDALFARVALLEASAALMASGPAGAAEAALYLGEARRGRPTPGFQDLTVALFAVAMDRDGKGEQAAAALAELTSAWALERFLSASDRARMAGKLSVETTGSGEGEFAFRERSPVLADGELHAAIGLAAGRNDPELASVHFGAFLESPAGAGPFAGWGRKKLASLGGGAREKR